MRNSMLTVAALLVSTFAASAALSPTQAGDAAGHDYCTSAAGFAPCPKLMWQPGAEPSLASTMPVAMPALAGREAAQDWCTAGAGFAKCAPLGQAFAVRIWQGPIKFAGMGMPVE
jgi:hypothetical protein